MTGWQGECERESDGGGQEREFGLWTMSSTTMVASDAFPSSNSNSDTKIVYRNTRYNRVHNYKGYYLKERVLTYYYRQ